MKKKTVKNKLIILGLSAMIAVAGYLNFNESKNQEKKAKAKTESQSENKGEEKESQDEVEVVNYDDVELNSDEEDIGEAVLTGAETSSQNMATAKLSREQTRSKTKESLENIINDDTLDENAKSDAIASYVALNDNLEKESEAETSLVAKGYSDAMVCINEDTVDVTLDSEKLSDTERAQIEDIVTRKTGCSVSQMVITAAGDK